MSPMLLLGQMLPLIVFIIVDSIFNNIRISIISAIAFAVVQLVLILAPDRFLMAYFGRMMPSGVALRPAAIGTMKTMLLVMCGYVLVHIGAVLYTAFYSSRKIWAFISGPGFFLFFIPVMAVILLRAARMRRGAKAPGSPNGLPDFPKDSGVKAIRNPEINKRRR